MKNQTKHLLRGGKQTYKHNTRNLSRGRPKHLNLLPRVPAVDVNNETAIDQRKTPKARSSSSLKLPGVNCKTTRLRNRAHRKMSSSQGGQLKESFRRSGRRILGHPLATVMPAIIVTQKTTMMPAISTFNYLAEENIRRKHLTSCGNGGVQEAGISETDVIGATWGGRGTLRLPQNSHLIAQAAARSARQLQLAHARALAWGGCIGEFDGQKKSYKSKKTRKESARTYICAALTGGTEGVADLKKTLKRKPIVGFELFGSMDRDGNGSVSVEEFREALIRAKVHLSNEQVVSVFKELDADGDGDLTWEEIEAALMS